MGSVATNKGPAFCLLYTPGEPNRFSVQMQDAPDHWVQELCLATELTAYLTARTKSKAKMCTYRVVDNATSEVVTTIRFGKTLVE